MVTELLTQLKRELHQHERHEETLLEAEQMHERIEQVCKFIFAFLHQVISYIFIPTGKLQSYLIWSLGH